MFCVERIRMNHKRLWVFAGITLVILCLNHIFGWSSYLSNMNNLAFLKQAVEDNLPFAIGIYMLLTIAGCAVRACTGDGMLFCGDHNRGGPCICSRTILLKRHYPANGYKE